MLIILNQQIYLQLIHIFFKLMQGNVSNLRDGLWSNLKNIFNKFPTKGGEMQITTVEEFIRTALGEETQQQIDYVMKNIFKLDSDSNGSVSFRQLANFLFRRHCAEMSLQVMHRANKMSHGSERKMNVEEFEKLCNNAWKFLKVSIPNQIAQQIFGEADKDRDGLITYVEYFQFIQKFICKSSSQFDGTPEPPKPVAKPVEQGPERFSRLRKGIWDHLLALYDAYVRGSTLSVNDKELRGLVVAIIGDLSEVEISFLLNGLYKMTDRSINFEPFAIIFIYLVGELGLSRYSKNHSIKQKTLDKDQFVILFRNSFKAFQISRIRTEFLYRVFAKIDKNNDGLISFDEYLDWVKRFLAVLKYFGDQFWVTPEDDINSSSTGFQDDIKPVAKPVEAKEKFSYIKFNFSNFEFAIQVRKRMLECLIPFDRDHDKEFSEKQITEALVHFLKEDEHELYYMIKNVFRYDRNLDNFVTYDELTDFCVEQHFGQMAIQRLHRKKGNYSRSEQRQMNKQEFAKTLNFALQSINIQANQSIIDLLWSEIDLDKSGWITYSVYFLFLKYYFGSQNIVFKKNTELNEWDEWLNSLKGLSPIDYFVRLLLDQLRKLFMEFDFNKNMVFETDEIEAILKSVFQLDDNQVSYVIYSYFRFEARQDKFVSFEQLVAIILEIFFVQIVIKRAYKEDTKNLRFSQEQFFTIVYSNTFFVQFRPENQLLVQVFRIIDTDNDGWITLLEYMSFIRKYLGRGLTITDDSPKKISNTPKPSNVPGVSAEELAFIEAIWGELKKYFDQYDIGNKGHLIESEIKAFVVEVLHETSQKELDYVFWNIFRVDPNGDRKIEFEQFAPFILSHAGEISLQRFHKEQKKGKSSLTAEEMYVVFGNAFSFLSTMPKYKSVVTTIHGRIGKGQDPSYGNYLGWITLALAKRFR